MTATSVPQELVSGDTWAFTLSFSDYSASTWTATAYFENTDSSFSAVASASGSDHAFSISASTTSAYKAGRYRWFVRVTDGTSSHTVDDGWVTVKPNPAAAGTRDHRSWARITLEAVEAFLSGNASTAQQSMSLNGRSISRWSLAELNQWRTQLRQEVRTEEQGESAGLGRNIKVRFGRG